MAASQNELPLTHELLPHLNDTRLLYVALFLHDIAKGRPEDHSIAGARIARKFCPRLGLDAGRDRHRLLADRVSPADERDRPGARHPGPRDRQGLRRHRAVAAAAGAADDPHRLRHPRRGPGRLDRLEGLAAALALLRHRAAALGRPLAGHPARPHRGRQGRRSREALSGLAEGRGRSLSWRATTTTTGCAPSPSCRSSMPA